MNKIREVLVSELTVWYIRQSEIQCADNGGVCPDDSVSNGGNDDVAMPTGQITNGIVRIKYKRPLRTGKLSRPDYERSMIEPQIHPRQLVTKADENMSRSRWR